MKYETKDDEPLGSYRWIHIHSEPSYVDNDRTASYHGKAMAADFKDACRRLANQDPDFRDYYNDETMTFWGCKLYEDTPRYLSY